jgi:nicotinic acid phosphoribosyltransferase
MKLEPIVVSLLDTDLYKFNMDQVIFHKHTDLCGQYFFKCRNKGITFTPFSYSQVDEEPYSKLEPCPNCVPPARLADIRAVNETYAPGRYHEELLNSLRQDYWDYLNN